MLRSIPHAYSYGADIVQHSESQIVLVYYLIYAVVWKPNQILHLFLL
jgi:hypothetical protein